MRPGQVFGSLRTCGLPRGRCPRLRFKPRQESAVAGYSQLCPKGKSDAASDGYQAAVAWGEIDPRFAATEVLLAYEEDRQPLARPRLVLPSDERGGRYVTDVTRVSLLRLGTLNPAGILMPDSRITP